MKIYYSIQSPKGHLNEDGTWTDKVSLSKLFNSTAEAQSVADNIEDAVVNKIHMKEDDTKGEGIAIIALLASLIFFPAPLRWATLVMIGIAVITRFVKPGKASEASCLVLLGYAIFGGLGYSCWWLVLPFILICYIADQLRKQAIENHIYEQARFEANQ